MVDVVNVHQPEEWRQLRSLRKTLWEDTLVRGAVAPPDPGSSVAQEVSEPSDDMCRHFQASQFGEQGVSPHPVVGLLEIQQGEDCSFWLWLLEGVENGLGDSGDLVDSRVQATEAGLVWVDQLSLLQPVL